MLSQWAPAAQAGLGGGAGANPQALATENPQRAQPRERSYLVESALPPPEQRTEIPISTEFDFETELELQQQNQKSAGQRFRFKH